MFTTRGFGYRRSGPSDHGPADPISGIDMDSGWRTDRSHQSDVSIPLVIDGRGQMVRNDDIRSRDSEHGASDHWRGLGKRYNEFVADM